MNDSSNSSCLSCQNKEVDALPNCFDCRAQSTAIEPMPVEVKLVFKPIEVLLLVLGLPVALLVGVALSSRKKVKLLGAMTIVVAALGSFGVGIQLVAAALVLAISLV